jgi:hypothetical protein
MKYPREKGFGILNKLLFRCVWTTILVKKYNKRAEGARLSFYHLPPLLFGMYFFFSSASGRTIRKWIEEHQNTQGRTEFSLEPPNGALARSTLG